MNSTLFFCKPFNRGLRLFVLILVALPALLKAQNSFRFPNKPQVNRSEPINYSTFSDNLKTAATATCPTSPVGLAGLDTLGNVVTNGQVFACNATPFYIYVPVVAGNIASPCIETEYNVFHTNLGTHGTETFYEGGFNLGCIGPAGGGCPSSIGAPGGVSGFGWGLLLSRLDPGQQHDFVFCRNGSLNNFGVPTTTVTLIDCWTGAQLPSTPTSAIFNNTNPPNTSTCFTMTVAPNTDIGTAAFSISPTVTPNAFLDLHDGEAYVNTALLGPGVYNVTYSFTPSTSSGCGMVTGTFSFSIAPNISVAVNSPTVCSGSSTTLTATASNGTPPYTYSWTPSSGLNVTTGSVVTVNSPTATTVYTVTAMDGGCIASTTSTVTVRTFTVNKAIICSGNTATLIASDSAFSYSWSPATGLNTTTNDTVKANPSTTTVYTVTGTNNPSCPSLTVTLTDSVIVNISPTISAFSPTVCSGTSATITAVGATSYTWSPLTNLTSSVIGDTVYISNPTVNATYTVYGAAANGCRDSAISNVVVSNHLGIVSGTPVNVCSGYSFDLSAIGASTYTWTSNDPANLNFGLNTSWQVQTSVANVGTYTVAIYGESHSGTFCVGHDTVYVTVYQTPTVTVAGNASPAICSGTSTTLTVNSSGPPITSYTWSPLTGLSTTTQSTTVASPTVTTVYTATGTTAAGCSSTASFTVSVIPVPSFTLNNPPISCLGITDSLKVIPTTATSGAQTYSWTPATWLNTTTGPVVAVTPTAQGGFLYQVIGTNTISTSSVTCTYSASAMVGIFPLPTVTVSPTYSICAGNTATLTAGGTAVSYTWNPATNPATGSVVMTNPLTTTIYTVTGTGANGCKASATTSVTVNNVATFTINNSNPVFCKGDSSVLAIVPTSTTAATYTWVASGLNTTTVTVKPTATTIYTVNATATSPGSCPSTSQTTVTVHQLPVLTVPTNTTICNGNSTTLTTSNNLQVYTWSPLASLSVPTNSNVVTANPTVTTTYSVTGQDAFGCHADTATVTVIVTTPTVIAGSNSPVCKGQPINLTANTNGTTYTWSASNGYNSHLQNPTISNATSTNTAVYSVTVSLGVGNCQATSTTTVVVDYPAVSVTPTTATVCPNGVVTYTASGASTYTWSPSAQLSSANGNIVTAHPASTIIYTVTGTDAANCIATATTTLHVDSIVANMIASPETGDAPLDVNFINTSVNASSYVWSFGNGSSNFTTGNVSDTAKTNYPNQGTYTVVLTATGTTGTLTCTDHDTLVIIVTEHYSLIIPNVFTPNGDGINENFMVKSEGVSTFSMEIFDRWGLKMFSTASVTGEWDGKTTGGKEVPADTYFYLINATSSKTGVSQSYKGYLTLIR